MILELDVGNSRIKWRQLSTDGDVIGRGIVADLAELQAVPNLGSGLSLVRVCCVRKGEVLNSVVHWIKTEYGVEAMVAKVKRVCGDIKIQYQDPSRLGVDRWLAMLAAYSMVKGACIVVDGGTALTVDVIAADGNHQGGYILPGLAMMATSLEQNTAIRLSRDSNCNTLDLGHSTEQAVFHGSLAALVALVEKVAFSELSGQQSCIVFSGGDAETLAESVSFAAINKSVSGDSELKVGYKIVPDLVLDGLAITCPDIN